MLLRCRGAGEGGISCRRTPFDGRTIAISISILFQKAKGTKDTSIRHDGLAGIKECCAAELNNRCWATWNSLAGRRGSLGRWGSLRVPGRGGRAAHYNNGHGCFR